MTPSFGEKLSRLRRESGLTQQEIATAIGLSPRSKGYVSELESGKKMPPIKVLIKLSSLFGVSIDQLVRDDLDIEISSFTSRKDSET